ncbi:uncharacterized protein LOC125576657 [Brassica napus]|uniref:uncharacterized protein LOC125576657 n=1 Tax=Brassica napus TaxID=3708 RepID=UPI002078A3EB|nr:uncharacterized protein LOC125576657 [Brassica napus]
MSQRYSRAAKEKWAANPHKPPRRPPVVIPNSDNAKLIEENKLTLIGRVTNPTVQKTRALVDFFTQHWSTVGALTGRDLGPHLFQFRFETEQDLQSILCKAPYHFKKWMIILQRWEPIVSDDFPAKIPFWIRVHDLPLHFWNEPTLNTIGEELGVVETRDADHGRVRVLLNGLKPLEMHLDISLPSGDIKKVELEYEKLEKHCFNCHLLSHENSDCPNRAPTRDRRADQGTISQARTLDRLEEARRRRDDRRDVRDGRDYWNRHDAHIQRDISTKGPYGEPSHAVSARSPRTPPPRTFRNTQGPLSVVPDPRDRERRPLASRLSDSRREDSHLSREHNSYHTNRDRSLDSSSRGQGTWIRKTTQSLENRLLQSQISNTPSPRPERETMSELPTVQNPTGSSSRDRGSALGRLSIPIDKEQLLQRGASIKDSGRLQNVEIHYLEESFPNGPAEGNSIPSSSRAPIQARLSLPQVSPIRSLSEDRRHVFERLGNPAEPDLVELASSEVQEQDSLTLADIRDASRAAEKRKVGERPAAWKRGPRSPLVGVTMKKRRVTKVQNSPKRRSSSSQQAAPTGQNGGRSRAPPTTAIIPAITKAKAGFRTAKSFVP